MLQNSVRSSLKLGKQLKRAFFNRSVHKVAPDLIGVTLLVDGVGVIIVEVEAYHHTEPAAHFRVQPAFWRGDLLRQDDPLDPGAASVPATRHGR